MAIRRIAAVTLVCSLACAVISYFNRDVYPPSAAGLALDRLDARGGWTAYAPLDPSAPASRFATIQVFDPYLWAGASIALLLVAGALIAVSRASGGA